MATNTNVLREKITYTICINSINKVNNNCFFFIPFITILPQCYCYDAYKIVFNMQSSGENYKDSSTITYSSAKFLVDFGSRSYQYDTSNQGPSMGVITRDIQSSTTTSNTFSAFFYQNVSKTITRPTNNQINIQVVKNFIGGPLYNTDTSTQSIPTNDMTNLFLLKMKKGFYLLELIK